MSTYTFIHVKNKTELLLPNAYAVRLKCPRQTIAKAIKIGLIPTITRDGRKYINPTDPVVTDWERSYAEKRNGRSYGNKTSDNSAPSQSSGTKKHQKQEVGPTPEPEIPPHIKALVDRQELTTDMVMSLPKVLIDKIKSYEQIKTIHQKRQQERRELISKRIIRIVFGKLYEINTTQFLTLKTKIIPGVAGVMSKSHTITPDMVGKTIEIFTGNQPESITAADKIIDEECYRILKNIKHDINKFLIQIKENPFE